MHIYKLTRYLNHSFLVCEINLDGGSNADNSVNRHTSGL